MIRTPLGIVEVKEDGKRIDCIVKRMENDNRCPELDGWYAILVDYIPDGREHTVSCCIKGYRASKDDFEEPEERANIKSFCKKTTKLSIGGFSDTPEEWGMRSDESMDYWTEYLKNGVQYHIQQNAKRAIYPFGIAWLENFNEENEVQTWYGADPTIWVEKICREEKFLFCCIKQEIDKWDPYGFFPDAPPDEYDGESRRIARRILADPSFDKLAKIVAEIFSASFGADAGFTVDSCRTVADKIEHRISKYKNRSKMRRHLAARRCRGHGDDQRIELPQK